MSEKKNALDDIAKVYDVTNKDSEFDFYYKQHHFEAIKKHLSGSKILELGCSTGLSTKLLSNLDVEITVVEGSKINIQKSKENFKFKNKVTFIESLWDEFKSKEKFSDILLVDSLQLISNRNEFLSYYKKF